MKKNRSSKGLWFKNTKSSDSSFTPGNWYQCIKDDYNDFEAFLDDNGEQNGWGGYGYNEDHFDIENPRIANPKKSKGLWFKFIDGKNSISYESFTKGNWYQCIKDDYNASYAFYDNRGIPNGWSGENNIQFDVLNPKTEKPKTTRTKKPKLTQTMQHKLKLEVTIEDVLKIHSVACSGWQSKIATTYLPRLSSLKKIKFSEEEVKEMFAAATTKQLPVLEEIFGKLPEPIQWDKLKTGSLVYLDINSSHYVKSSDAVAFKFYNPNEPVTLVLKDTPYYIDPVNKTLNKSRSALNNYHYYTFCQGEDNWIVFWVNKDTLPNYILSVKEY